MRTSDNRAVGGGVGRVIVTVGMLGLIVGLGAVGSRPVRAEIQNDAIGFSPNHVFESTDQGEQIDVMSGNLMLTIPLGPRYRLTDTFSYGVTLYYNAKLWEHECENGRLTSENPCNGKLNELDSYGLGFSLLPGRVYHHEKDKPGVYRVQLEDGADHFFASSGYTTDSTHLNVLPSGDGWTATTTDGKKITFGRVLDTSTHEALVSRIETIATRPDGQPRAWVEYSYFEPTQSGMDPYRIREIKDSQGRKIAFVPDTNAMTIRFPAFAENESYQATTTADYVLHFETITLTDPSYWLVNDENNPHAHTEGRKFLTKIDLPAVTNPVPPYEFKYIRPGFFTLGGLTERKLPTGAVIDYYYDIYSTSYWRPLHSELKSKVLTASGQTYRWNWNRFTYSSPATPAPPSRTGDSYPSTSFSGSNPYAVKVTDPFGNLTLYNFKWTAWSTNGSDCNEKRECTNTWSDGLLESVLTYAGPDPDSGRMVRRVDYTWDSERNPDDTHRMFQHREGWDPAVHAVAVNAFQTEERTFVPGAGGNGGHTVTVKSSSWYPAETGVGSDRAPIVPRQKDEYVDGALYRSTYTEIEPSAHDWSAHRYVEVSDRVGNVVSRVDRKFTKGQLECEVRRGSTSHNDHLGTCSDALAQGSGDIRTVNTFDDPADQPLASGAIIASTIEGGDAPASDSRTIAMEYLKYPEGNTTARTGYLKSKLYGFSWMAMDRDVDFNTGLVFSTRDPAQNATSYRWDELGRLTEIRPKAPEQPTIIAYPNVHETDVVQGASGNSIETVYLYDDLGRVTKTKKRNATGSFDMQRTDYDMAGRIIRKSEWAPDQLDDSGLAWTVYDYTAYTDPDALPGTPSKHADPLGRLHGVTTPDDTSPETPTTEYSYNGDVTTVTVRDIRGWVDAADHDITATTVLTKDALGRLVSVESPGSAADATYAYDELDNLTEVRLTDPANLSHVQVRRFEYDRLGRLRAASNPESGTVEYLAYDARGNLLRYKDARGNVFAMTYDTADRLLTRRQIIGSFSVPLVANVYDVGPDFDAGGAFGRLVQQESFRVDSMGLVLTSALVSKVRFGYGQPGSPVNCSDPNSSYTGLNGRLAWQKSAIQPWGVEVETKFCEDTFGLPTTVMYPYEGAARSRTIARSTFKNGYLWALGDTGRGMPYIRSVGYAPGGVPTMIERPSGFDYIELDLRNRPSRFRTIGRAFTAGPGDTGYVPSSTHYPNPEVVPVEGEEPSDGGGSGQSPQAPASFADWNSGVYTYDMAGNIRSIGLEEYHYDPSNRLVHASIPGVGLTYLLDFGYDAFGNMLASNRMVAGNPAAITNRAYTIDWRTNRLTQQTVAGSPALSYSYDENGNMTTEGLKSFVFDALGRLEQVTTRTNGRLGNYDYDASGYRVRSEADGVETFFFRNASGQVLSEFQRPIGGSTTPIWNKDYIYAFGKAFVLARNDEPAIPKKPWATNVTGSSLLVNWTPVVAPDIYAYHVEQRSKTTAEQNPPTLTTHDVLAPATTSSFTFSGAEADNCLTYVVRALDTAYNDSAPSKELVVCPTLGANPPPPSNVRAIPADKIITLRWDPVSLSHNDLWGYYVERSNQATGPFVRLNATDPYRVPEYVDKALINGHAYWYRVRTVDTSGRISLVASPPVASEAVVGIPNDTTPPGKVHDVFAEPDCVANRIVVSWKSGVDPDVASYAVYRRMDDAEPTTDSPVGSVAAAPGQETYIFTDVSATAGATYYYSVKAIDSATPPNASAASDRSSARARVATASPPVMIAVEFVINDNGTTSTDGLPPSTPAHIHRANIEAEDDDIMQAKVTFYPGSDLTQRVYRKAPGEAHFTRLTEPFMSFGPPRVFIDSTIAGGEYTYFVAGVNASGEETAGTTLPASGSDHFVRHANWGTLAVRNLTVQDGRALYTPQNRSSRLATVRWSRVVEPEVVGYNVYRMCSWRGTMEAPYGEIHREHFACEPVWIRLNKQPVSPSQRYFEDASVGGLAGSYLYAVRPVGPYRIEGPIGKIVTASLQVGVTGDNDGHTIAAGYDNEFNGQVELAVFPHWTTDAWQSPPHCVPPDSPPANCYTCANCPPCQGLVCPPTSSHLCDLYCYTTCPTFCPDKTVDYVLNQSPEPGSNDPPAINTIARGTGDADAPVPAPTGVVQYVLDRNQDDISQATKFARIAWTMTDAPADLLGFHVEATGSPEGPWQRLTEHPVAWWERSYVAQGVAVARSHAGAFPYSGHGECLSFRVIAVDEDGNESSPATCDPAAWSCPKAAQCPGTPPAPTNLQASEEPGTQCRTRLEWGASPDAREYHVYRMVVDVTQAHFYETQLVIPDPASPPGTPPPTMYVEDGDPSSSCTSQDHCCDYPSVLAGGAACAMGSLDAFYVTARGASGGESPRSNLVFWRCKSPTGPYSKLLDAEGRTDSIASLAARPPDESLACWDRPDASADVMLDVPGPFGRFTSAVPSVSAPMLHLGEIEPQWTVVDLHTDHLGTVRAITDLNGQMVSNHNYFPFGEEMPPQPLSYNTHRYTGHERDKETGLDYMLARYYEANLGRFVSTDPGRAGVDRGRPATWNLYTYSLDNPLTLADRTGKTPTVSYAPGTSEATINASVKYLNTPSMQAIPSSMQLRVENKGNIVVAGIPREGVSRLEIGYAKSGVTELKSAVVQIDPNAVGKGSAPSDKAVQDVVGHEFGHVVDAAKNPGAVLATAGQGEARQSEAEGEKAVMDVAVEADEEAADEEQKMCITRNEPHIVAGRQP